MGVTASRHVSQPLSVQQIVTLLSMPGLESHNGVGIFRLAARQVQDCIQSRSLVVRLHPAAKAMLDIVSHRIWASADERGEIEVPIAPPFGQRAVGMTIP